MLSGNGLTFSKLSKQFQKRQLLDNVELELTPGHCILLTGKNGSGKTTLMRILAGLEKPDHCEIEHAGNASSWRSYRRTLQSTVLYLHQHPYMFSGSVRNNLAFALPRNLSKAEGQQRIEKISDWAGLNAIIRANAKSLSGGELQRVAIARALLRNPSVLLLDEPTANMDRQGRETMLKLLLQLRADNLALLVTSHEPELFSKAVTSHLQLENGQLSIPEQ